MIMEAASPSPGSSGARGKVTGRLTENDAKAIARDAVSVERVAPFLSTMGQVVYGDKNAATMMAGTTTSYFPIRRFGIAKGELWTETDELLKTKVCVIGTTVADKLFGTDDPIGRTIRIGRSPYRVVGLLEPKGTSPFGEDQDDRLLMPIGSFRARVMHTVAGPRGHVHGELDVGSDDRRARRSRSRRSCGSAIASRRARTPTSSSTRRPSSARRSRRSRPCSPRSSCRSRR